MENNFEFVVEVAGIRLDNFVLEKLNDRTRSYIKNLIDNDKVLVNGKVVKAGYKVKENDVVTVEIEDAVSTDIVPEDIPLDIVYEDEDLAVINKKQGMVVHPARGCYSGTLVNAIMHHMNKLSSINGEIRPGIVHRLDKDTSGLIVIAKNDKTHLALQKQIQSKECHRIYRAICLGKFRQEEGVIQNYLARGKTEHQKIFVVREGEGRLAITNYKVLKVSGGFSYVEFELKTGRTHQIRVHSAHLGHPVIGDPLYGRKDDRFNFLNGQLLHAYKLEFTHPTTNEKMEFTADFPEYFKDFLNKFVNWFYKASKNHYNIYLRYNYVQCWY